MRSNNQMTVVNVTRADEEQPIELREAIRECLRKGLDVLVLCRSGLRRRVARMALAMSKHRDEFPDCQFVVVTPSASDFVESLPSAVVQDLPVFESADQAIHFLNVDDDCDFNRTTVVWPAAV